MPKITKELSMWFDYPDDPFGGRVHVRYLKPGEIDAINEKCRELKTSYVKEFRQAETVMRIAGAKTEAVCKCIKAWENFFDETDKPMECTPANIRIMCLEGGFIEFIDQCLATLDKQVEKKQKAEEKN